MEYRIHGKKFKVTNDIKSYVETKLGRLDKYFENPDAFEATVVIRTDGVMQVVEITVPAKRMILRAEETNKDPFAAIDLVLDKLERQIRKNKTRMSRKGTKDKFADLVLDFEVPKEEKDKTKIVKRKEVELKPMSEEEAILQMELTEHDFFVFKNSKEKCVSVVYKRKDGKYGIINAR